jgi:uncharacterized membrane protein YqgA involved in biofilm formation
MHSRYDLLLKLLGLAVLTLGVENASKGRIILALLLFLIGGALTAAPITKKHQ